MTPFSNAVIWLNSNGVDFTVNKTKFTVQGANLEGQILQRIPMTATINLQGDTTSPLESSGSFSGKLVYNGKTGVHQKLELNASNYVTVDFDLSYGIESDVNFVLKDQSCSCSFTTHISMSIKDGSASVVSWLGDSDTKFNGTVTGNPAVTKVAGDSMFKVSGAYSITVNDHGPYSFSKDFTF